MIVTVGDWELINDFVRYDFLAQTEEVLKIFILVHFLKIL